jgi:hypothetical protein
LRTEIGREVLEVARDDSRRRIRRGVFVLDKEMAL